MKRITYKPLNVTIALVLSGTLYSTAFAATPPTEAINACSGLSEDANCNILTPNGNTISGICQIVKKQLACVPNDSSQPQSNGDGTQTPPSNDDIQLVETDTQPSTIKV